MTIICKVRICTLTTLLHLPFMYVAGNLVMTARQNMTNYVETVMYVHSIQYAYMLQNARDIIAVYIYTAL